MSGALRPGQRVAREDTAQALGVSVAPVREALRVLEQEGQVTYLPRRGYFVTELRIEDLEEIDALRKLLEANAARRAVPALDDDRLGEIDAAAQAYTAAVRAGEVAAELGANRRFHFAILSALEQPHAMRVIRLLWDCTEAYRAIYSSAPSERVASAAAHDRILAAIHDRDPDRVVAELDAHRERALAFLRGVLAPGETAAAA